MPSSNGRKVPRDRGSDGGILASANAVSVIDESGEFAELSGHSASFRTRERRLFPMLEELAMAAEHDLTILLVGETGTGKSTLAKVLHERSTRASEPFMPVACGALQPTLLESELFGHIKGAFTGADTTKAGRFEAVGEGTLLLDEIDVFSLGQQVKLLRVIETGEYEPVGSTKVKHSKAKLIVASNYCLQRLVELQKFRQDLYYRLNVLKFGMPALRERPSDIEFLATDFINEFCGEIGSAPPKVTREFLHALRRYAWPGNLRELKNTMQRAVALCRTGELTVASLPPGITGALSESGAGEDENETSSSRGSALSEQVSSSEKDFIIKTLHNNRYNRTETAKELGVSRVTLYNKMRKYDLFDRAK